MDDDLEESHVQHRRLLDQVRGRAPHPGQQGRIPNGSWGHLPAGVGVAHLCLSVCPCWALSCCLAPARLALWLRGSGRLDPQGAHASDGVRMLSAFMVMFGFLVAFPNRRRENSRAKGWVCSTRSLPLECTCLTLPAPVPAHALPCPGHPGGLPTAGLGGSGCSIQRSWLHCRASPCSVGWRGALPALIPVGCAAPGCPDLQERGTGSRRGARGWEHLVAAQVGIQNWE